MLPRDQCAEDDRVLPVLRPVGGLLGTEKIGQTRHQQRGAEDLEADRARLKILVSLRSGRLEYDVQAAGGRHEIPEPRATQRRRAAVEGQTFRHALRIDACLKFPQRRGEAPEIRRLARWRDVRIGGQPRKTLQPRRQRADQHVSDFVTCQRLHKANRIEWRNRLRHAVPRLGTD